MSEHDDVWRTMDKLPIALIVDDPMPCINPLYYFHKQVRKVNDPPFAERIPVSMLEGFIDCATRHGARGNFTVVPIPAGLGSIADGLPGFDDAELHRWIELVRTRLMPAFDIHPEILTHTLALDLDSRTLLDESEHDWMGHQDEDTLTEYFTEAMAVLKQVGLPNNGITQPCGFAGDRDVYARAILRAEQRVNGRSRSHYFLDILPDDDRPLPYSRLSRPESDEHIVSVPSPFTDAFWPANDGKTDHAAMADYYLSDDGQSGRMIDRLQGSCPLILHTHWQSLYGNGTLAGLKGLDLLLARIDRHLAGRVRWMKISEIAEIVMARPALPGGETTRPDG